jgi:hypothetical protein
LSRSSAAWREEWLGNARCRSAFDKGRTGPPDPSFTASTRLWHRLAQGHPTLMAEPSACREAACQWRAGLTSSVEADVMRAGIAAAGLAASALLFGGYVGLVSGALAPDLNVGRRMRPLGPLTVEIDAPRELVFDIVAAAYEERQPRALSEKVQVLDRGSDMVLAVHRTPVRGRLVATTVETVRFSRPERVDFRLVRGPVPYVVERFGLTERGAATTLTYTGELGTDLWAIGERWGILVAGRWEAAVVATFDAVKAEAERRASRRSAG